MFLFPFQLSVYCVKSCQKKDANFFLWNKIIKFQCQLFEPAVRTWWSQKSQASKLLEEETLNLGVKREKKLRQWGRRMMFEVVLIEWLDRVGSVKEFYSALLPLLPGPKARCLLMATGGHFNYSSFFVQYIHGIFPHLDFIQMVVFFLMNLTRTNKSITYIFN